jgi:cell division transport system ATP-binding protein
MLNLRHVSYAFGSSWALRNCTLSLQKGEFLFLCGPSGAGKTTLLRLLYGDLALQQGSAEVAGFDLKGLKANRLPLLRRQVSLVFQDFKILPDRTVYENVDIALQVRGLSGQHVQRRVRAAVRTLGLEHKLNSRCRELSGGEQQRVAVARAIVVNPQLILADEPTGNLDPGLSMRLMDIFLQFNAHGTTVILATHNPDLLLRMPSARMIRLEDGAIAGANWPGAAASHELQIEEFITSAFRNNIAAEESEPANIPLQPPEAETKQAAYTARRPAARTLPHMDMQRWRR